MTIDATDSPVQRIEVRFFAAAKAAAGRAHDVVELPHDATVGDLEAALGTGNADLARVLLRCSYLRDSVAVRDRGRALAPCSVIEVLPPFAGG
ncbi:MoaD/ThiS family protein [Williamsia maris]|uniref:Molybdopterin converting factor, small subunit n=1 Tax=Williamsia maris TaxID=72806 RepID=A0ABT1H9F5_9NOCA|nr:MoaD/ThiS family protein [Williamsia maris]MCP2174893.1 Molybdopterin converting factor, small subunit [Williamsia maris]